MDVLEGGGIMTYHRTYGSVDIESPLKTDEGPISHTHPFTGNMKCNKVCMYLEVQNANQFV